MIYMRLLFIISAACYSNALIGQQVDRSFSAVSAYASFFPNELYQGKLYGAYPVNVQGHQSYKELGVVDGCSIVFNGVQYDSVPLMLDLVRNQVVSRHPQHLVNIILPNEFISEFTIGTNSFAYLDATETSLPAGFYERKAETSDLSCYAKWTKEYREDTRGIRLTREFVGNVVYYLRRGGADSEYQIINSQTALLRAFKEHRRQLRKALFERKLDFKANPEATLEFVLDYVSQLN